MLASHVCRLTSDFTIVKNLFYPLNMLSFTGKSVDSFNIQSIKVHGLDALQHYNWDNRFITGEKRLKGNSENRPKSRVIHAVLRVRIFCIGHRVLGR